MHKLLIGGMILFILGLLTGAAVPAFANPRLGLIRQARAAVNVPA